MKAALSIVDGERQKKVPIYGARLALALVLVILTAGCVIIPIPIPETNAGDTRANISQKTPQQFELGKSTRTEIISVLGEPDAVTPDELMMGYRSSKIRGIFVVGTVGAATGGPISKDSYLVFEFDPHGVLQKMESSAHWMNVVPANSLLSSSATTNVNLRIRLQNKAHWQAGVDGYHSHGAPVIVILRTQGQLLLTDTELRFISEGQFINGDPALFLPYAEITAVRIDTNSYLRRLVVHARAGEVHSFDILKPKSARQDKPAMQAACDFIQSKIQPARVQP